MARLLTFGFIFLTFCLLRCHADAGTYVKTNAIDKDKGGGVEAQRPNPWRLIEKLHAQIAAKESELENAVQLNRGFERMIQLVSIMGQVDAFLTNRTRTLLEKLSTLAEDVEASAKSKKES